MKILITDNPQDDTYTTKIWDGPDGINYADFVCGSLGECLEQIIQFRIMNGLTYVDDDNPKEAIRSYFNSINQELLNAAHRVSDGGVPLGKLIKEGHQDPMVARVRFEYAALLRELVNQCGYDNFDVDGDHGILVINVRDVLGIIEILEEMK
jgi:hypothetical protein